MQEVTFGGRPYAVDEEGFLLDYETWDDGFAEGLAGQVGISGELTPRHWQVLRFIRAEFERDGQCPIVFRTCKANGLRLADLQQLFPAGYQRGACRLAGITYADRRRNFFGEHSAGAETSRQQITDKVYRVNALGFLIDPAEWDEAFALHKSEELRISPQLSHRQWEVILFLRDVYARERRVATLFETCEALNLEIGDLEELFPTGYHRGAVKLAGLRVRL